MSNFSSPSASPLRRVQNHLISDADRESLRHRKPECQDAEVQTDDKEQWRRWEQRERWFQLQIEAVSSRERNVLWEIEASARGQIDLEEQIARSVATVEQARAMEQRLQADLAVMLVEGKRVATATANLGERRDSLVRRVAVSGQREAAAAQQLAAVAQAEAALAAKLQELNTYAARNQSVDRELHTRSEALLASEMDLEKAQADLQSRETKLIESEKQLIVREENAQALLKEAETKLLQSQNQRKALERKAADLRQRERDLRSWTRQIEAREMRFVRGDSRDNPLLQSGQVSTTFNSSLVDTQVKMLQGSYLGRKPRPLQTSQRTKELPKLVLRDFMDEVDEAVTVSSLEEQVKEKVKLIHRLKSKGGEFVESAKLQQLENLLERDRELADEEQFLSGVSESPLEERQRYTMTEHLLNECFSWWDQWRYRISKRRASVLSERTGRLNEAIALFDGLRNDFPHLFEASPRRRERRNAKDKQSSPPPLRSRPHSSPMR
eukprot:NODE_885_length_1845_cov_22.660356_g785_i0.p1 GENE.NODE_885_length_1845_cov_22.660356_g785_i0~~NODE_885_length_1845_cov_22.660356_g785_i0.p1  ORF type:complete len:497 (+),score=118.54 NODE_885_length_1845_cov_22.660356_g785_i0:140-1630(+)